MSAALSLWLYGCSSSLQLSTMAEINIMTIRISLEDVVCAAAELYCMIQRGVSVTKPTFIYIKSKVT